MEEDVEVFISFVPELILAILFVPHNQIQNDIATIFYYITTCEVIFNITLLCYIRVSKGLIWLREIRSENWFNQ